MIWCRCNAHLVESDDDQTPDAECCACNGKRLQAARRRWFAAGAEKPNAPDCSEASCLTRVWKVFEANRGRPHASDPAGSWQGQALTTMPHPHRNVKPENMPHGGRR